jgi:UDP-glucose 4-epimerase
VRLLQAAHAAGVRRVVFSSSSSVYGDTPALPKVEDVEPRPRSPYAASKLAAEQYILAYARAGLVEGVALRYFNVFGPRQSPDSQYAAVVPLFFRAAMTARPATVFGDGGQTRDFTYIANVVDANLLAATAPADRASGYALNAGAGSRTSINELLAMIERVTGRSVARAHRPPRAGDVRDSQASLDRVGERIGYRPEVGLAEGLRRTWEWFEARESALTAGPG